MSDRTINFGESETEATYQIQDTDSTGGGNFVVAKDTNANTVLLQYDPGADTWEYAGDVDMNGGNVSGVGTLTAESVNTEEADIGRVSASNLSVDQDNADEISSHSGDRVFATGGSTVEIFNFTGTVDVIYGSIYGRNPRRIIVTFGDGSTDTIGVEDVSRAEDQSGDEFEVLTLPSLLGVSKLEFSPGFDGDYGWRVQTI